MGDLLPQLTSCYIAKREKLLKHHQLRETMKLEKTAEIKTQKTHTERC